jgi:hypothetical protein
MARRPTALCLILMRILAIASVSWMLPGELVMTAPAWAQTPPGTDRPVDKLSVGRPTWHRGAGLLSATMTFMNRNPYPVWKVIIACEVYDQSGQRVGTRATGIHRVFEVGKTHVSGVYFTATSRLQAGDCRILSAQRYPVQAAPTS